MNARLRNGYAVLCRYAVPSPVLRPRPARSPISPQPMAAANCALVLPSPPPHTARAELAASAPSSQPSTPCLPAQQKQFLPCLYYPTRRPTQHLLLHTYCAVRRTYCPADTPAVAQSLALQQLSGQLPSLSPSLRLFSVRLPCLSLRRVTAFRHTQTHTHAAASTFADTHSILQQRLRGTTRRRGSLHGEGMGSH